MSFSFIKKKIKLKMRPMFIVEKIN
jgi:hypothetical protein